MKGIEEIEFIISVFIFITSLSFASILVINNIPLFHNNAVSESLKTESWQHSELLLFDEGYPDNWESSQFVDIQRIGLSSGTRYYVDMNKVNKLASLCSDMSVGYASMKTVLGLDIRNDIIIQAAYLDDTPLVGASKSLCEPAVVTQLRPQFQTVRFGILDMPDKPIIMLRIIVL